MKKNKLIFVLGLFLIGCNVNTDTITKEEYQKLKGDTSKIVEPKKFRIGESDDFNNVTEFVVELGSDGHEYAHNPHANTHHSYVAFHYVDCQLCKSRMDDALHKVRFQIK